MGMSQFVSKDTVSACMNEIILLVFVVIVTIYCFDIYITQQNSIIKQINAFIVSRMHEILFKNKLQIYSSNYFGEN